MAGLEPLHCATAARAFILPHRSAAGPCFPGHVGCRSSTSRLSVRTVGFEPTISWPPARRDTRLRHALPSSIDPCGIRTQPGQLERLATSPEVERAVCGGTYLHCVPANRFVLKVGWKALESFSPGLQPGAKPSQLPAHLCSLFACSATKKPSVLCVTPGCLKARGRLKADVTCAGDTEILRYANLHSPNCQQMEAGNRNARFALRADSPR